MRFLGTMACAGVFVAAACSGGGAAPTGGDGLMVLEVGGEQRSLRQALQKAGLAVPPPIDLAPAPAELPPAELGRGAVDGPRAEPRPAEPPPPAPTPPPKSEPESAPAPADYTTVTLGEGQTLIHLARKHLGDGNRFRDILALNGWTEAESRRLKPGTKVKIPKAAAPRRSGR